MPVAETNKFGQIFIPSTLAENVVTTLDKWFPRYLRQIEEQLGLPLGQIGPPKQYRTSSRWREEYAASLPHCVVIIPGLAEPPTRSGKGVYSAVWTMGVGIASGDMDDEYAELLAQVYSMATVAIIENKLCEDGIASHVNWIDLDNSDLELENQNTNYKSSATYYQVRVNNVVNKWGGPDSPIIDSPPDDDWSTVETVGVIINKRNIDESVP